MKGAHGGRRWRWRRYLIYLHIRSERGVDRIKSGRSSRVSLDHLAFRSPGQRRYEVLAAKPISQFPNKIQEEAKNKPTNPTNHYTDAPITLNFPSGSSREIAGDYVEK